MHNTIRGEKTILIVEDELSVSALLRDLLEAEGYHTLHANHGAEALSPLQELHPDLVMCDLMMPVMDGWQLCEAMASDPEYKGIPIVVMSAAYRLHVSEGCNCVAKVSKPFDMDYLLNTVEAAISR